MADDDGTNPAGTSDSKPLSWVLALIFAATTFGLIAALFAAQIRGPIDDWLWVGTLGEWLSAFGTLVAVGATVFWARMERTQAATHHESQMALLQADLDLARAEIEARAKKDLLDRVRGVWAQLRVGPKRVWAAEVYNATLEPIYEIELDTSGLAPYELWVGMTDMVSPGQTPGFSGEDYIGRMMEGKNVRETYPVAIRFADARGERWRRSRDGSLTNITNDDL